MPFIIVPSSLARASLIVPLTALGIEEQRVDAVFDITSPPRRARVWATAIRSIFAS